MTNVPQGRRPVLFWASLLVFSTVGYVYGIAPLDRARMDALQREAAARAMLEGVSENANDTESFAARRRIGSALARIAFSKSDGDATGTLLRVVADAGERTRVRVVSVAPEAQVLAVRQAPIGLVTPGPELTIDVQGGFRGAVAFIEQISQRDALLDVRSADLHVLAAPSDFGGGPMLDSTVHVTLYRTDSGAI